jgi:eukaryotic-like serine/threonine-protein kinase
MRAGGFAAQLALAKIHPRLAPVMPVPGGYLLDGQITRGWFELPAPRGLAGYGLARALRILLDVLSGLTALHNSLTDAGAPFVHGEVVPALLRVDRQGVTRLVPLAPWHRLEAGTLPARERHPHLAPERLLGDALDQRADVFSCGVLLWEALAGRRLFQGDSVDTIVTRLMGGKLQLPELPPELSWATPLKAIAMCALAVDPGQRFADCAELAVAIEEVAGAHLSTHEEVALFFGAREHSSRPPPKPLNAPNHNSSLSALVSPVQIPERAEPAPESQPPASSPSPSSAARKLWLAAALLSVLAALGVSFAARRNAAHAETQGVRSGPMLSAAARPQTVAAVTSVSDAASATPALSATPSASEPMPAATSAKARKGHATEPPPNSTGTQVHVRPAQTRDKSAEQYGI